MSNQLILTVTELNRYVRLLIEGDPNLTYIFVTGEISNFKAHYASGHLYFSLKDDGGLVRSVMFRSNAARLKWTPENGMKVICRGRVSLYEKDGQYQFYVDDMQPDGIGALSLAAEQLRKKLAEKGLFDESRKRPLPKYPRQIAVLTSATGAAVRDILSILSRRFPLADVLMCPVTVQGETAAKEIADTLDRVERLGTSDLIILGRGGGSIEDLWAFNEEILVRKVAGCKIPVISAVGHETDYTLCDLAADLRAPTPSAAAELAVPDAGGLLADLRNIGYTLVSLESARIDTEQQELRALKNHPALKSPLYRTEQYALAVDGLTERMRRAAVTAAERSGARLSAAAAALNALSPLAVLARGYALVYKEEQLIGRTGQLSAGDEITLRMNGGAADCTVRRVEETVQ